MPTKVALGTERISSHGYVQVRVESGWKYKHRIVMEAVLGRALKQTEDVHHKDHDKQNNAPDNLELLDRWTHMAQHRKEGSNRQLPNSPNPVIDCACGCKKTLRMYDELQRPRSYIYGHWARTNRPGAKISKDMIVRIKELRSRGLTYKAIAKQFGVSDTTIGNVLKGAFPAYI